MNNSCLHIICLHACFLDPQDQESLPLPDRIHDPDLPHPCLELSHPMTHPKLLDVVRSHGLFRLTTRTAVVEGDPPAVGQKLIAFQGDLSAHREAEAFHLFLVKFGSGRSGGRHQLVKFRPSPKCSAFLFSPKSSTPRSIDCFTGISGWRQLKHHWILQSRLKRRSHDTTIAVVDKQKHTDRLTYRTRRT